MTTIKRDSRILDEMHETLRGLHATGLIRSKYLTDEFRSLCNHATLQSQPQKHEGASKKKGVPHGMLGDTSTKEI